MLKNEIVQLKSYDEQTGQEIGNVLPITNSEAVKVEDNKNLKEKLTEINKQIEQTNASLNKRAKQSDLKTLESRINTFTALPQGSTVGDAELIDGRVGCNGQVYNNIGENIRDIARGNGILDGRLKIEKLTSEYYEETYNKIKIINVKSLDSGIEITHNGDIVKINGTGSGSFINIYVDKPSLITGGYYLKFTEKLTTDALAIRAYYTDGTFSDEAYLNNIEFARLNLIEKPIDYFSIYIPSGITINYENKIFLVEEEKGLWDYVYKYKRNIVLLDELEAAKNEIINKIPSVNNLLKGKKWTHVGDSIGAGNGATNVNWQKEVSDYFEMSYVNCGVGGRTTGGMGNYSSMTPNQYDLVPDDSDIISFNGGTNDFIQNVPLEKLRIDIITNFRHYKEKNGKVKIFMVNLMNGITKVSGGILEEPLKNDLGLTPFDYAKCYIDTCNEIGIPCLNLFGKCGVNIYNSNKYIVDGIHPNDGGYKLIVKVYIDFINSIYNYLID